MNAFSKKLPLDTVSLPYKGYDKWSPDIVLKRELVSLILPIHCPVLLELVMFEYHWLTYSWNLGKTSNPIIRELSKKRTRPIAKVA